MSKEAAGRRGLIYTHVAHKCTHAFLTLKHACTPIGREVLHGRLWYWFACTCICALVLICVSVRVNMHSLRYAHAYTHLYRHISFNRVLRSMQTQTKRDSELREDKRQQ